MGEGGSRSPGNGPQRGRNVSCEEIASSGNTFFCQKRRGNRPQLFCGAGGQIGISYLLLLKNSTGEWRGAELQKRRSSCLKKSAKDMEGGYGLKKDSRKKGGSLR